MKKLTLLALLVFSWMLFPGTALRAQTGTCLDPSGNPTALSQAECQNKFFSGYRWSATAGVCLDAARRPVNLNKTDCEKQFGLGYKWDPAGTPPRCYAPMVLEGEQCVNEGDVMGTCRRQYTEGGATKIELTRTAKKNCTGAGRTWRQSTQAQFDAEVAALSQGGGGDSGSDSGTTSYKLLSPLPCPPGQFNCTDGRLEVYEFADSNNLGRWMNLMLNISIGIGAVMATIILSVSALERMGSTNPASKEHASARGWRALGALVLLLIAWPLLYTINPALLKADPTSGMRTEFTIDLESDSPQTPTNGKYKNGVAFGANWETTSGMARTPLPSWVTTNNGECTTVGQQNCTSTRGLIGTYLNQIHAGCPTCTLVITGGTEFWLHGGKSGNTTHRPGSPTIDLRPSPELNTYLSGGKPLRKYQRYGPGGLYYWEGNHWHIGG